MASDEATRTKGLGAATASAECAWILWAGGVKAEQLKRDVAGAGMKLAFTCLPDTVDPRGPKRK
jgi:hypothetical protein